MSIDSRRSPRISRAVGLLLGGLFAFLLGGMIGFFAFLTLALIATVFTIRR